jgi:hypothetical protein
MIKNLLNNLKFFSSKDVIEIGLLVLEKKIVFNVNMVFLIVAPPNPRGP